MARLVKRGIAEGSGGMAEAPVECNVTHTKNATSTILPISQSEEKTRALAAGKSSACLQETGETAFC